MDTCFRRRPVVTWPSVSTVWTGIWIGERRQGIWDRATPGVGSFADIDGQISSTMIVTQRPTSRRTSRPRRQPGRPLRHSTVATVRLGERSSLPWSRRGCRRPQPALAHRLRPRTDLHCAVRTQCSRSSVSCGHVTAEHVGSGKGVTLRFCMLYCRACSRTGADRACLRSSMFPTSASWPRPLSLVLQSPAAARPVRA